MRIAPLVLLLACAGGGGEDTGTTGGLTAPEVSTDPAGEARSDADVAAVLVAESTGADGITYRYDWASAGVLWQQETLPATATLRGETWTLTVTPLAGDVVGPPAQAEVLIVNSPPSLASASFSGAPATGQDLTCVPGAATDPDGDDVSFRFGWTIEGAAQSESSDTLPGSLIVAGDTIACTVTPTDGEDDGAPVTITADGQNQPPTIGSVAVTPAGATVSDLLTCTATDVVDPDGDTVTLAYAWTVDGTAVPNASTHQLGAGTAARGEVVVCTVTPNDGTFDGTAVASPGLTIANSPPAASAAIDPSAALSSQDLTCTGNATDADNDTVTWSYLWTQSGTSVGTAAVLPAASTSRDLTYQCTATADDGNGGTDQATASVFVENSPPSLTGARIAETAPTTTTPLTCIAEGFADADGDSAVNQYAWFRGTTQIGTGATLAASAHSKDDVIHCQITPGDGLSLGTPVTSATVTIGNTAPTAPGVRLDTTAPAAQGDDLICEVTASTDADNDTLTYAITWYQDGQTYTGPVASTNRTGDTLAADDLRACHTYSCRVAASDGTDSSPSGSSQTATAEAHPMCGGSATCATGAIADGPYYAYGTCLWLGTDGASCDEVCASSEGQGGAADNASPAMTGKWPSACATASNNVAGPTGWFFEHGNAGGWSSSASTASGYNTIGYGVRGGAIYGECGDDSLRPNATWPGYTAASNQSHVCACGDIISRPEGVGASSTNWVPRTFSKLIIPDQTMLLYQTSLRLHTGSATACTMAGYLFESASGSTSGPWVTIGSWPNLGTVPTATGSTVVHPAQELVLEAGKAYAFGISTGACAGTLFYDNNANSWANGTYGYCMSAADGTPPTSTQCTTSSLVFASPTQTWILPQ